MLNLRSLLPLALLATAGAARADITSLADDFNSETQGLNYTAFANFDKTADSVDLIGTGFYDLYPGNGNYVDLDGTTNSGGTIATKSAFAPGAYTLSFDLGGNARGAANDLVTVTLGTYSEVFNLASGDPLGTITRSVNVLTSSKLTFSNAGGDNQGAILDNVSVQAVPEPASMIALGLGGLGLLRRRRK